MSVEVFRGPLSMKSFILKNTLSDNTCVRKMLVNTCQIFCEILQFQIFMQIIRIFDTNVVI